MRNSDNKFWWVIIAIVIIIAIFFLAGCNGIGYLNYQGKERPVTEVEEMLSDYLEAENGGRDFNVTITNDVD